MMLTLFVQGYIVDSMSIYYVLFDVKDNDFGTLNLTNNYMQMNNFYYLFIAFWLNLNPKLSIFLQSLSTTKSFTMLCE